MLALVFAIVTRSSPNRSVSLVNRSRMTSVIVSSDSSAIFLVIGPVFAACFRSSRRRLTRSRAISAAMFSRAALICVRSSISRRFAPNACSRPRVTSWSPRPATKARASLAALCNLAITFSASAVAAPAVREVSMVGSARCTASYFASNALTERTSVGCDVSRSRRWANPRALARPCVTGRSDPEHCVPLRASGQARSCVKMNHPILISADWTN